MPTNGQLEGRTAAGEAIDASTRIVSDRSLVVRNYDGSEVHELRVAFCDPGGEVAFARTFTLAPLETIAVETRLERAVYRVEARLAGGGTDSAECLVGSGPNETALVETGNGTVSVVEGIL